MNLDLRSVFELRLCIILPIIVTGLLVLVEKDRGLKNSLKYKIFAGIIYGIIAVFGTEIGIQSVNGTLINLRDASVICAGMAFGLPGGIIAGVIGSVERILAAYVWHSAGTFTAFACALSTLLAGTVAGIFGNTIFKNKTPSVLFGLIMGIATEINHLGLAVLFRLNYIDRGLEIVRNALIPMIICNTVSVVFAIILIKILLKKKQD